MSGGVEGESANVYGSGPRTSTTSPAPTSVGPRRPVNVARPRATATTVSGARSSTVSDQVPAKTALRQNARWARGPSSSAPMPSMSRRSHMRTSGASIPRVPHSRHRKDMTTNLLATATTRSDVLLATGRVLNGLLAGLYLAFAVAVMPALHGLDDDTFSRVMNRVNVVILNPVFLLVFLGAPAVAVALAVVRRDPLTVAAAVAALVALVVTVAANVPLNDALAAGGTRDAFETPWLVWHGVRTAAATGACVLLCLPQR